MTWNASGEMVFSLSGKNSDVPPYAYKCLQFYIPERRKMSVDIESIRLYSYTIRGLGGYYGIRAIFEYQ